MAMVHRDDPGQPCVSPSGNEWAYMYIRRTNSAILEATADTPAWPYSLICG